MDIQPAARFDDLRPWSRRSFELRDAQQVLVAHDIAQVAEIVAGADRAVRGGAWVAGFLSYEAASAFDPALATVDTDGSALADLPLAWFAIFPGRSTSRDIYTAPYSVGQWNPLVSESSYRGAFTEVHDAIRRGDTYQVNLTFPLESHFEGDALTFYRDLTSAQTCGYGAFLDTGRWVIVSASPELFFEWQDGSIRCRPMKGTIRRGNRLAEDMRQRTLLGSSLKDRAENVMIVDMMRNDLGRIAQVGSVRTPELFSIEKYDTVWQLTSTVVAEPRPDVDLFTLLSATFPSASITGAPKVSTMEIIRRLETEPRGVYCGAIGFGGPDGLGRPQWAFNVAIRTVLLDRYHDRARYGVGGGVTIDSTADGEYAEALLKAEVLARRSTDFKLIETFRWDGGFWLLEEHMTRLVESCEFFDIPLPDIGGLLDEAVADLTDPALVRLLVARSGMATVEIEGLPAPLTRPLRLELDESRIDQSDLFLFHKSTNRTLYEKAIRRHPEVDDVVLVNRLGNITETTIGNLAVFVGGRWYTPPVGDGCLPGTYRAKLVADGWLRERSITVEEIHQSEAIARINSVRGWEEAGLV